MAAFIKQSSPLGYLTSRYWSPSALWTIDRVVVLTGLGFFAAAVNAAIRNVAVIRAFRLWRHLLIPGSGRSVGARRTLRLSERCAMRAFHGSPNVGDRPDVSLLRQAVAGLPPVSW